LRRTPSGALCGNIAARIRTASLRATVPDNTASVVSSTATSVLGRKMSQDQVPFDPNSLHRLRLEEWTRDEGDGFGRLLGAIGPAGPFDPGQKAHAALVSAKAAARCQYGKKPRSSDRSGDPCDPSGAKPAPSGAGRTSGNRFGRNLRLRTKAETDAPRLEQYQCFRVQEELQAIVLADIRVLGHGRKPARSRRPKPASSDKGGGKRTGDLRVLCRLGLRPSLGCPRSKRALGLGWEADPSSSEVFGPLKGMVLQPLSGGRRGFRMGQPQRLAAAVHKGVTCR
jgi:hypothetical protein